jgi:hypothetical protein
METTLVRRDQFNISPQGIVHKPTDAAFTPNLGDPHLGTFRRGQLANHRLMKNFDPDSVKRMMQTLWLEYVTENQDLFRA